MNKQALDRALHYLNSWLTFRSDNTDIPGYSVAIAHKGVIVFNKAFGMANLEHAEKLTTDHLFRVASHSKTFTATAIMQLAEAGTLTLDDKLTRYLPWLKAHKDARYKQLTIRQVLSHGGGIIRDGLSNDYWQVMDTFPDAEQLKADILKANLVLDNNIKMKYSNFGFGLLGMVIETVSQQSYRDYMNEHVITPLGLKNTGTDYIEAIESQLVTGYTRRDFQRQRLPIDKAVAAHAVAPAAGFYSTAADLCTYFSAQLVGSGLLLNDESKKEMQKLHWETEHTAEKGGYGFGYEVHFVGKHTVFGHSGGFPGQVTNSFCDPEDELVVVVLTNGADGSPRFISRGILSALHYFNDHTPTRPPKHDLMKFEGRFMSLWSIVDFLAFGDTVIAVPADNWIPFVTVTEKLSYVDETTLKIEATNSYMSYGEQVAFHFSQAGTADRITYAGATMLPPEMYIKKYAKAKSLHMESKK